MIPESVCLIPLPRWLASIIVACGFLCSLQVAHAQGVSNPNLAYRDTTCAPCTAFYEYANGSWIKSVTKIAPDAALGTLDELNDRRVAALERILDSLRDAPAAQGSQAWKLREFYNSCMNVRAIESAGVGPIMPEIERIAKIGSLAQLQQEIARLHMRGVAPLFLLQALPDARDSRRVIADLMPFGYNLGDRGMYDAQDSASSSARRTYKGRIARTLQLSGVPAAQAAIQAAQVLELEGKLSAAALSMMDRQDPATLAHPSTILALDRVTPGWSWETYFRDMGLRALPIVNVEEPLYFRELGRVLAGTPLEQLKSYVRWRYTNAASVRVGGVAVDSLLGEYGRGRLHEQSGTARKRLCVDETEQHLGWILGRFYAASAFTPAARARANAMVRNIRATLRIELDTMSWISAPARKEAKRKLDAFVVQIGYPDHWPDYSGVVVKPGEFLQNAATANEYQTMLELARVGHPQRLDDWWSGYWPQTNDAYFNENLNEVVLAGGNMQPPMFDPDGDDASNYGAIGSVIGHEMTHGFDERGRKFDSKANLRDWWGHSDEVRFAERVRRVEAQYDSYVVVDTLHINGRQTLSENLADIGGVQLAYAAFERSMKGKPRSIVDGYTPEQRFFIAYAQSRRGVFGPDYLRDKVANNNHSPEKWRVIGPITNMPEFAQAFHCKAGEAMVAQDSALVRVW
jgi:putative endopeptidase